MDARSARKTCLSFVLPVALVSGAALAAPASAAESSGVRARTPAHLVDGGGVDVRVRARCAAGLTAFELGATVRQGAATASTTEVARDVVACDGRHHTRVLRVVAPDATFSPGAARVDVYLATFDPQEGDVVVTRTSRIRLTP